MADKPEQNVAPLETNGTRLASNKKRDPGAMLFGIGSLLIAVGSVAIWLTTRSDSIWWVIGAMLVVALGVWCTYVGLPQMAEFSDPDEPPAELLGGWVIIAVGLLVIGVLITAPWSIALAAFGGSMVVAPLAWTMRRQLKKSKHDRLWMFAGLGIYTAGGSLIVVGRFVPVGAVLLLVGLILYRAGLLPAIQKRSSADYIVPICSLVAFAFGVMLMFVAVRGAEVWLGLFRNTDHLPSAGRARRQRSARRLQAA